MPRSTPTRNRPATLTLCVAALAVIAATCSSSGGEDTATTTQTSAAAAAETTTTAAPTTTAAATTTTEAPATTTTTIAATTTTVEAGGMTITSPAYGEGETIPMMHTCDGVDVSPEYHIEGIPAGAASLVAVMDDPDAPVGVWDHWVVYDLPVNDTIPEGAMGLGTDGVNSWGELGYGGPCPPAGDPHHYILRIYALNVVLDWPEGIDKVGLLTTVEPNILDFGVLTGLYGR